MELRLGSPSEVQMAQAVKITVDNSTPLVDLFTSRKIGFKPSDFKRIIDVMSITAGEIGAMVQLGEGKWHKGSGPLGSERTLNVREAIGVWDFLRRQGRENEVMEIVLPGVNGGDPRKGFVFEHIGGGEWNASLRRLQAPDYSIRKSTLIPTKV